MVCFLPGRTRAVSCPPAMDEKLDMAFLHPLGTLSQDPHQIILFVASLLPWGEGSTLPETTTELALMCAWALKTTHSPTSPADPRDVTGKTHLGFPLAISPCLKLNSSLHNDNNKLKVKYFGVP